MEKSFSELLRASFKSADTEEWLDIYFTRPIGLAFALLWARLGVHPNTITILSMFLGIGAGWMFSHTDLWHNIAGIVLLMFQLLRLHRRTACPTYRPEDSHRPDARRSGQ